LRGPGHESLQRQGQPRSSEPIAEEKARKLIHQPHAAPMRVDCTSSSLTGLRRAGRRLGAAPGVSMRLVLLFTLSLFAACSNPMHGSLFPPEASATGIKGQLKT